MTLLCYDEIWVREPRLMVPRGQPQGPVKLRGFGKYDSLFLFNQSTKDRCGNKVIGGVPAKSGAGLLITGSNVPTLTTSIPASNTVSSGTLVFHYFCSATTSGWCSLFEDGQTRWRFRTEGAYTSIGAYFGGYYFVATVTRNIYEQGDRVLVIGYGGTTPTCFLDGSLLFSTGGFGNSESTNPLYIGAVNATGAEGPGMLLKSFMILSTRLPDGEARQVSNDPYQLVSPA